MITDNLNDDFPVHTHTPTTPIPLNINPHVSPLTNSPVFRWSPEILGHHKTQPNPPNFINPTTLTF